MPDGEGSGKADTVSLTNSATSSITDGGGEVCSSSSSRSRAQKDPRKVARNYQLELCKKALEENIIVYLGTGCGKTHIAVLLIYELGYLIRKPQKNLCIFLAPTVALVHQQAKVIEDSTDFTVGVYGGSAKHLKSHSDWQKEIEQYEVLVMTPQILLRNLSHSFIKMELIALLIFDECHHAQVKSSHPYAQIMKVFYRVGNGNLPRVFGMTASPVVGKGASKQANLPKAINSLENLLNAKVYSVEDKEELERFVASPVIKTYTYGPVSTVTASSYFVYQIKLLEIKRQCMSELGKKADDQRNLQSLQNTKKMLNRLHDNLLFALKNLGLWGALQACQILLNGDQTEWKALMEAEGNISDDSLWNIYLAQSADFMSSECTEDSIASNIPCVEVLKEPFFSRKLLRLIGILSSFRLQPNMKCIIFVNRIVTARSLACILQNLKFLTSWKCDFLVGVHSGLKSMSRKNMNNILEKFRTGKLNLLVATKVGEEGLDIQTCCFVIRFDLPETVASFIQSRGRARMPQSEYVFLVDSGNQKELDLIENFKKDEYRMEIEISQRTSDETFVSPEERVYKVDASGATISAGCSISLLHHYCSKLPHDEYFDPKPQFFYYDDVEGTICHIILPSNAPIHQIVSTPQSSMDGAKRDACLTAIEQLHKMGALNDFLLPEQEDADEETTLTSSDSSCEDEGSRGELHEMLVPAVLKASLNDSKHSINLNCYYIEFCPVPDDRTYKKFALFVQAPLPQEAERMELDLHLAHGRYVITKLVPAGLLTFSKDEITQARNFQEMFLKVILDRSEFLHEFVPLGKNGLCKSTSTFYLLLPVIWLDHKNKVTVDWEIVRRCLSSPVFQSPDDVTDKKRLPTYAHLQLMNGQKSISDIENSLVCTPHKEKLEEKFYFITNIAPGKNGYSRHKGFSGPSYMEHLHKTYGIHLKYPHQPLLRAKPLFLLRNLLHNRRQRDSESQGLDEYFIDLAPELCELKILGFSKDMGSSISLLPSIMHRLENLLVAIELKCLFSASFSEGAKVTAHRVLEALTTEKCQERLSLERLEILGDAFLKFAVGRHLFLLYDTLDEGELTRKRSNTVNNSNLYKLATKRNLQVYIRDQPFDPCQFFALGRSCLRICTKETEQTIHCQSGSHAAGEANSSETRCSKGHHWLHKKTIADVVEALVGAFIVDSGFKAATAFLRWIGIIVDFEASQLFHVCQASGIYMQIDTSMDICALENLLGYQFLHRGLLLQAFVHPSYNKHGGGCYQRLEFLGDAVLDYLITSYLFSVYPKLKPGHLTDLRSVSVNNRAFANVAADRSFHKFLLCDSSELTKVINDYVDFVKTPTTVSGITEGPKCPKVLGDLVESCLGAVLLDTGFDLNCIWKIMLSFLDTITKFSSVQINPVRELKELCQSRNWNLEFPTVKKGRAFVVEVKVNGQDVCLAASASNLNKKEAIRIASEEIFVKLKAQGYAPKVSYLEEVLRTSPRMEAKLIGYDETPITIAAPCDTGLENLNVQEPFGSPKIQSISKMSNNWPLNCLAGSETTPPPLDFHSPTIAADSGSHTDLQTTGGESLHKSARSRLYEICAANCWKSPVFECCCEEGPSHMKYFTYTVMIEIEAEADAILECVGTPQMKKKAAAENAAEGALWYLEHEGYLY